MAFSFFILNMVFSICRLKNVCDVVVYGVMVLMIFFTWIKPFFPSCKPYCSPQPNRVWPYLMVGKVSSKCLNQYIHNKKLIGLQLKKVLNHIKWIFFKKKHGNVNYNSQTTIRLKKNIILYFVFCITAIHLIFFIKFYLETFFGIFEGAEITLYIIPIFTTTFTTIFFATLV